MFLKNALISFLPDSNFPLSEKFHPIIFLLGTLTASFPSFLVPLKYRYRYTATCCAHLISPRLHSSRTIKCAAHFSAAIQVLLYLILLSPRNLFAQCLFNNSKACCSVGATLRRVTDFVRPSAATREPACGSGRGFASSRCTVVKQRRREIELSRLVSALGERH